ncbi:MAG: helix-turn-helix domain-containing protein [Clostridia bacterium]|nr:helix-turn-helix domain-containing protein [Clostridia bacterium]
MTQIAKNIRLRRLELGLSQQTLADLLGYTDRSSIAKIEAGRAELTGSKILALAEALCCSADALLGKENTDPSVCFNVIGEVSCGFGSVAYEEFGEKIEIPVSRLHGRKKDDFFVLKIKGQSMYPDYRQGDLVLIEKTPTVKSGQVGVVIYDDEMGTLKRIEFGADNTLRLIPINPSFPPVTLKGEELSHCKILGVPRLLIREIE